MEINLSKKSLKTNLEEAKKNKNDEFYTQITDIEKELKHYKAYFKNKVVLCNCDDPEWSNFWKYFELNFKYLGLKKLIGTYYDKNNKPTYRIMRKEGFGSAPEKTLMQGNGDFRSDECIQLLKQADIVVTNPPFSLFREYVAQLIKYKKKFIIIGHQNAISYKEIFPLFKENKIWLGVSISSGDREFRIPDHYEIHSKSLRTNNDGERFIRVPGIRWYTNLNHSKRKEEIILYKEFNEYFYLKYDNYDAININKTKEIPINYKGTMGVPITFMDKYNPDQFEIVGQGQGNLFRQLPNLKEKGLSQKFVDDYYKSGGKGAIKKDHPVLGIYEDNVAKIPYMRILIKRKGE